jgi:hypothetical protein
MSKVSNAIMMLWVSLLCVKTDAFDVTSEKVTEDKSAIKKHIFKNMAGDIATSENWFVKSGRLYLAQVSQKVYDSRPLEFFDSKNKKEAKEHFKSMIDAHETSALVQKKITKFMAQKDSNSHENLGDFLFGSLVDHLEIEEAQKNEFKDNPAQLNQFIKTQTGSVREQYFKLNVANCIVHHYLTHHYDDLKKHHGK